MSVYARRWRAMIADEQRWFLQQIGDINHPETVRIALDMACESSIRGEAGAWFGEHLELGLPFLKENAARDGSTAVRARALLRQLS